MLRYLTYIWVIVLLCVSCAAPAASTPSPTAAADTPTLADTDMPTIVVPTDTAATESPTTSPAPATIPEGGELLFIQNGSLVAYSLRQNSTRPIVSDVVDFAPSPDGMTIAVIRRNQDVDTLWLVDRASITLTQLGDQTRTIADVSWTPDGNGLVYASSEALVPQRTTWLEWARFCRSATVMYLTVADKKETSFGTGCDPVVAPDGRRLAYVTRPSRNDTSAADPDNTAGNTLHLVNMQGENGWDPVTATGGEPGEKTQGLVVYRPQWSADGKSLIYHVFVGMRVEVDINLIMRVDAFDGTQTLLGDFAGWARQTTLAPRGDMYAITTQNTGDARGFTGWDVWDTTIYTLNDMREIFLPEGSFNATGTVVGEPLARAQRFAWQPDGQGLAVVLPPDWSPGIPPNEEYGRNNDPGDIWIWPLGQQPTQALVRGVDQQSPIAWVP
ncbi:MAG: hypothetical protein ACKO83_07135 [Roseiflexaceae bacterium]